ncbi:helix-turn-helix domain-containing protein [Rhodococcus qingshengii]
MGRPTEPTDEELGERLAAYVKEAREAAGIKSIREAARIAQMVEGSWRNVESGRAVKGDPTQRRWIKPTVDTLHRIADALDVEREEILRIAGTHVTYVNRPDTIRAAATRTIDVSDLSDEAIELLEHHANLLRPSKSKRKRS